MSAKPGNEFHQFQFHHLGVTVFLNVFLGCKPGIRSVVNTS